MLNALATLEDVGCSASPAALAGVVTLVLIGVQGALTPLVYAHHHEPQTPARLARLLEGFSGVALAACLALGLFGAELMALLATPEYAAAAPLLGWLAGSDFWRRCTSSRRASRSPRRRIGSSRSPRQCAGQRRPERATYPALGRVGRDVRHAGRRRGVLRSVATASQRLYPLPLRHRLLAAAVASVLAARRGRATNRLRLCRPARCARLPRRACCWPLSLAVSLGSA